MTPLVQLDARLWLLGCSTARRWPSGDLALQLSGCCPIRCSRGAASNVTIVGFTSGDTGSAALAACRDKVALDIFFLYPEGRISEVQRRQMTTTDAGNA